MAQVVALQRLAVLRETAHDTAMEKVSELSYFACGPLPSEISAWACV
ncbi:hypothetical protein [Streptomyces malaysiense]|nr:hypothetical protein [Streptomyces malaysiense]